MTDILVVEEKYNVTRSLKKILEVEGYQAVVILNGEDAVQFALRETPHLILLDVSIPGVEGYEMLRRLREHPKCMHVPIIMLSDRDSSSARVHALDLGVDGYLAKPFDEDELLAHVHRQLCRVQQSSLSPLTKLPAGQQVERAISFKVNKPEPWSIFYLDLDNFKAYNDAYGFLAGNDMIRLVSDICKQVVHDYGSCEDFVGHVGGDDFIIVTTPDRVRKLCDHILARYKQESIAFYRREDLERGSISGLDRKGRPYQFPLVSLSIGIISNRLSMRYNAGEIGLLATTAKRRAKLSPRNICHIVFPLDRYRQEYYTSTPSSLTSCALPSFDRVERLPPDFFSLKEEELQGLSKSNA